VLPVVLYARLRCSCLSSSLRRAKNFARRLHVEQIGSCLCETICVLPVGDVPQWRNLHRRRRPVMHFDTCEPHANCFLRNPAGRASYSLTILSSCVCFLSSVACQCPEGWTGDICSIACEGDACKMENTCLHGGTYGKVSEQCYCEEPWTGSECQEYDYCNVAANENGGYVCEHEVGRQGFRLPCRAVDVCSHIGRLSHVGNVP
jgi:hypothetical protein